MAGQKITPFLWFDGQADEAAEHYVAAFKDSEITHVMKQGEKAFVVTFTLAGIKYQALNGGPMFKPTEAFSFFVECEDQAEVNRLWAHFLDGGGTESQCGWLKDRWGYSWQIIPKRFMELVQSPDREGAGRVMQAMMQMVKFDVAALETAFRG
ncbi:MAG: VOC family protein [Alphaproteobacteria bacterium]|nr:VOC family protein [Alphaproteobacteria bacterium]